MKQRNPLSQIFVGLGALLTTLVVGTLGYMILEGWDIIDAFYMAVITISTTGFKEVHDLSHAGRLFTLALIFAGIGSIAYTSGRGLQLIMEAHYFRSRRMTRKISELESHYIVCGFGRMGRFVCAELAEQHVPFAVIEKNPAQVEDLRGTGYLFVAGDATDDDILIEAGIRRAKGMAAVLATDAENVFATLSAKVLNPALFIVARAVEEETESKLKKAGASRVVKPYEAGGTRMAELLMRPGVVEFIDIVSRDRSVDLSIEEVTVEEKSALSGKNLAGSPIRQELNVIVVSVNRREGKIVFNPRSDLVIEPGDRLFALGERSSLLALHALAKSRA